MIYESSGKAEFLRCLGTNVPSGVKRQRTCESLGKNSQTPKIKEQEKHLFNLTVLFSNVISPVTKNTFRGGHQQPKNYHQFFYVLCQLTAQGVWTPQPVALLMAD